MGVGRMLRICGDYVEDMLIFAQCSINILSNHHKGTSTAPFPLPWMASEGPGVRDPWAAVCLNPLIKFLLELVRFGLG